MKPANQRLSPRSATAAAMRLMAGALILVPGPGLAQLADHEPDEQVQGRLRWDILEDQGCPTEEDMLESVEERLQRRVFEPSGVTPTFLVRASIRRGDDDVSWRARIALESPDGESLGERLVLGRDPRCAALRGPLAIIISLLVEQHREQIVLIEPPLHTPPTESTVSGDAPPAGEAREEQPTASFTFGFQVGAIVEGLALPGPAFGLRQVIRLGWEGVPVAVGLEAKIVPQFTYATEEAATELWYGSAGLTVCPVLFDEPAVRTVSCAGVNVGQSHTRGLDLDISRYTEQLRVDIITRFGASIRLVGPLRLIVVAMIDVPVIQQAFTYGPATSEVLFFEGLPISLGLSTSVGFFFPEP